MLDKRWVEPYSLVIKWVPIGDLMVDERYQRALRPHRVEHLVTNWDDYSSGVIIISLRADGRMFILDGQHRVHAMMKRGVSVCKCEIFEHLPDWKEAQIFVNCNVVRGTVTKRDVFRAKVMGKDDLANIVAKVVEEEGYKISLHRGVHNPKEIAAVGTLEMICSPLNESSAPRLRRVLRCVKATWPDFSRALDGKILLAFAHLFRHAPQIHDERLQHRLSQDDPDKILARARNLQLSIGGQLTTSMMCIMIRSYNYKLTSNRIAEPMPSDHA